MNNNDIRTNILCLKNASQSLNYKRLKRDLRKKVHTKVHTKSSKKSPPRISRGGIAFLRRSNVHYLHFGGVFIFI